MLSVILTELGIVVFEEQKFVKSFPFSVPAEDYVFAKKGKSRLSELVRFLQEEGFDVLINDVGLQDLLKKKSIESQMMSQAKLEDIQLTKPQILVDAGLANNYDDAIQKLREFAIQLSSSKVTEVSSSPDLHIIQCINSLDDTDKIINGMSSRLREWYGLHFPELDNIIDSINGYAQIVVAGKRDGMSDDVFVNAGFPDSKVQMLSLVKQKSRGGDITEENLQIVQKLAKNILTLFDLRNDLEKQVDVEMEKVAPNLSAVLGTTVGARILAKAGSLAKMGRMPASTIQVLGAEKALFRALKTGSNPPKHGILFQHAIVHAAPRWQRGKIARAIAAKAAIAARVDVHGAGLNTTLLEKLNIRVKEIEEKNSTPVKKPQPQEYQQRENFHKSKESKQKRRGDRFKNRKRNNFERR
ncbi:MAG: ribonucleotide-diphosphate reductase subunit beta [Crenarchaeota archaeon]|nr:ribonucleotide-diphosphate reductase subunit beta [Thermoproteota archaeon]MDA1124406.1 ribonucleotide-diphosphate reductase subunit beta [Thermoproteota archaeon]